MDLNQLFGSGLPHAGVDLWKLLFQLILSSALGALIAFHVTFIDGIRTKKQKLDIARAQVIICMGGALLITIIGDSIARAFGIFGIAAFMRFRTPVNNPTDGAVLFILLGIGMAVGMEIYDGAVAGTVLFYIAIWVLMRIHITPKNQYKWSRRKDDRRRDIDASSNDPPPTEPIEVKESNPNRRNLVRDNRSP